MGTPEHWGYWRDLPPHGHIGIFLSAWYSAPLLRRAFEKTSAAELDEELEKIVAFERTLVADGALILKFWMHLGKVQQKERLQQLESDPAQKWRISKQDWKHWKMYDKFAGAAEQLITRTSTGRAPWHIVEGLDFRFRSLKVGTVLLGEMERRLSDVGNNTHPTSDADEEPREANDLERNEITILSRVDLTRELSKSSYNRKLSRFQARLNLLHREAYERKVSTVLVFEGWDAAGKGGSIRRITSALDARNYQVISIAAPTDEEKAHHYLWRFWRHVPRGGSFTIYDRSWYGRVLVERVEGFAEEDEWRRGYAEINDFERELVDHGTVLVKFWVHISPEEQERRFHERKETPYKKWKLTEEDWRNREKWAEYEAAVDDMVERTSTGVAPWHLIPGNNKRYARTAVLKEVCDSLQRRLKA